MSSQQSNTDGGHPFEAMLQSKSEAMLQTDANIGSEGATPPSPPVFHRADSLPKQEGRLYNILEFNEQYVANEEFKKCHSMYRRGTAPGGKRICIVTCMDTRLTYLLPLAMNLKENDAKIIKNAGAVITHPFGGIMRSVMVAIFGLDADEVFVIGHHDCGMTRVDASTILGKMVEKGIARHTLVTMQYSGIDIFSWLSGFKSVEDSVANSVDIIRNHPLMPISIPVHGLVIDPFTGRLDLVVDGYKEMPVLTGGMPLAQSEWLKSIPSFSEINNEDEVKNVGEKENLLEMHERAIASVAVRARSISSLSDIRSGDLGGSDAPTVTIGEQPPASVISNQTFSHLGIELGHKDNVNDQLNAQLKEQQKAVVASATGVDSPNSHSIGSNTLSIGRAANRQRKPIVFSGAGMGIN
jgi:carbonic anhydrase